MARKHLVVGLAAAGVLGLGVAVPAVAFAENGTTTPSTTSSDDRKNGFAEALAEELDVPADKVTAALKKMHEKRQADRPERGWWRGGDSPARQAALKKRLADAVKEGKLTQEQADAISAAVESGVLPRGHWGPRSGR